MKYAILTFGCRVNQADSLGIEEQLRAGGAAPAAPEQADVVVVNTCSVTASADQAARQTVRRIARTNPSAQVIVTGCYATRRPEEFRDLPHVLRVVPNGEKSQLVATLAADLGLPAMVTTVLTTAQRFGDGEGHCGAAIEPGVAGRTAFTLRVQTGCAQPCAYCIIPATRGEPRSVRLAEILAQVDRVAAAGFKEIALTGVHLGSYGRDLDPPSSLLALLRALAERGAGPSCPSFEGGPQDPVHQPALLFRISSLEPMDCVPAVVDLVSAHAVFAPHFHLPLQHASNRLLQSMRRPYTREHYAALVDSIRAQIPTASIGSDVIVGFPGESDEDFAELCDYLVSSPLTHLHVFPYSDRPGTAASSMPEKIAGELIRARAARIREIGHRLTSRFREQQLGTIHRALTLEDGCLAVTGNYLKVRIPSGRGRNEWVRTRITAVGESIIGELV